MNNPKNFPINPPFQPVVLTTSAILTLNQRRVLSNNSAAAVTYTLPSAPPDGTLFQVTQVADTYFRVTIVAGGTDKIVDAVATSIVLSGLGSSAWLCYSTSAGRWQILNLQRQSQTFRWDTANANEYLQRGQVLLLGNVTFGGTTLSGAVPVQVMSGTVVVGNLFLQSRANVGANTTIKVRVANAAFSTATDLASNLAATVASGTASGQASAKTLLTGNPDGAGKSWLVLQATTAIGTALDVVLEYYVL